MVVAMCESIRHDCANHADALLTLTQRPAVRRAHMNFTSPCGAACGVIYRSIVNRVGDDDVWMALAMQFRAGS